MHLDVELTLGRNLIEATATSIALHIDDAESVAGILADALEAGEQTRFYLQFEFFCFFLQLFFFLTRFLHDFFQFAALLVEVSIAVGNEGTGLLNVL